MELTKQLLWIGGIMLICICATIIGFFAVLWLGEIRNCFCNWIENLNKKYKR